MAKKNENLPATAGGEQEQFAIMKMKEGGVKELMETNFGSDTLAISDLTTVTVPSGGATTWEIPSIDGPIKTDEITGIVVFTRMTRTFWKESFEDTGGGTFPDCYSLDCRHGVGVMADLPEVGGLCKRCPMDSFGSGPKGEGKACKEKRQLFMVLANEILPILVRCPVKSLGPARQYIMGLTSRQQAIHSVYTKLTLVADKNKKGMKYSKIQFQKIGEVENPMLTEKYAESIRPYLEEVSEQMVKQASVEEETFGTDDGMN